MRALVLLHRLPGDEARRFCVTDLAAADTAALINLIASADIVVISASGTPQARVLHDLEVLAAHIEDIEPEDWNERSK